METISLCMHSCVMHMGLYACVKYLLKDHGWVCVCVCARVFESTGKAGGGKSAVTAEYCMRTASVGVFPCETA